MKIVITTPYVSTNRLYTTARNGRRIKTRAASEAKEAIAWEAKAQYMSEPKTGALKVRIDLFHDDKRRRDLDNIKGLIDALTGVLWEDDSQIVELTIKKHTVVEYPRVEITI